MPPFLSFIIPSYNAEPYIANCLQSLMAINMIECEFIVVNHGSTNRTGENAHEYCNRDSRFQLRHIDNLADEREPSKPRNIGIEMSRGKWIAFVDSDDMVNPDVFNDLLDPAELSAIDVLLVGVKRIK